MNHGRALHNDSVSGNNLHCHRYRWLSGDVLVRRGPAKVAGTSPIGDVPVWWATMLVRRAPDCAGTFGNIRAYQVIHLRRMPGVWARPRVSPVMWAPLAARPGKSPACEPDPSELGHVSPSGCTCTEHATRCCSLYRQLSFLGHHKLTIISKLIRPTSTRLKAFQFPRDMWAAS